MIQLIDKLDCDALHKSIVKPEAFTKAVLIQDAGTMDHLFALVMVDKIRAVLVTQGSVIRRTSFQRGHRAHRGQTTHPQYEPVDGPCSVRGLTTAPRLPPTA